MKSSQHFVLKGEGAFWEIWRKDAKRYSYRAESKTEALRQARIIARKQSTLLTVYSCSGRVHSIEDYTLKA